MIEVDFLVFIEEENVQGVIIKFRYMQWRDEMFFFIYFGFRIEGIKVIRIIIIDRVLKIKKEIIKRC